jgi:hypothetical protein
LIALISNAHPARSGFRRVGEMRRPPAELSATDDHCLERPEVIEINPGTELRSGRSRPLRATSAHGRRPRSIPSLRCRDHLAGVRRGSVALSHG